MSYPSNKCGECPAWLSIGESEGVIKEKTISDYCINCKVFLSQKFVKHIPTQCCYPLEDDGKTVVICGARLAPEIDNKFWEYTDKYVVKMPTPSDPYAKYRQGEGI